MNRARPMAVRLKNKSRVDYEPRSAHGRAVKKEDLRSYNRAYKDLTVFLALHSQRSAHSNALLDDSLITVHSTSIIHTLSKFLSSVISLICGEDTISVPGIVCGTIWGSFPVLGSFAIQFGDHLRYWDHLRFWDHLRAGIICGPVQFCNVLHQPTKVANEVRLT